MEKFQTEVEAWMDLCFGQMIAGDKEERNWRFLEEAIELVQACGGNAQDAHQLVDYVFGRETGKPDKEAGDVAVTLCALLSAHGFRLQDCAETVLCMNWENTEAIRQKQASKPLNNSPLPE